jgi:hypothetical protein
MCWQRPCTFQRLYPRTHPVSPVNQPESLNMQQCQLIRILNSSRQESILKSSLRTAHLLSLQTLPSPSPSPSPFLYSLSFPSFLISSFSHIGGHYYSCRHHDKEYENLRFLDSSSRTRTFSEINLNGVWYVRKISSTSCLFFSFPVTKVTWSGIIFDSSLA